MLSFYIQTYVLTAFSSLRIFKIRKVSFDLLIKQNILEAFKVAIGNSENCTHAIVKKDLATIIY